MFSINIGDEDRRIAAFVGEEIVTTWGSQDGVDRSHHFAIFARLNIRPEAGRDPIPAELRWNLSSEVGPQLQKAVREALKEVDLKSVSNSDQVEYYQVGPASENVPYFVATLWEHKEEIATVLSLVDGAVRIVEVSKSVKTRLNAWIESRGDARFGIVSFYSLEVLQELCMDHVKKSYHPRAKLMAEYVPLAPGYNVDYSTLSHPTEMLEVVILVRGAGRVHGYRLTSDGEVSAHFRREGAVTTSLPIPDLFAKTTSEEVEE